MGAVANPDETRTDTTVPDGDETVWVCFGVMRVSAVVVRRMPADAHVTTARTPRTVRTYSYTMRMLEVRLRTKVMRVSPVKTHGMMHFISS